MRLRAHASASYICGEPVAGKEGQLSLRLLGTQHARSTTSCSKIKIAMHYHYMLYNFLDERNSLKCYRLIIQRYASHHERGSATSHWTREFDDVRGKE